MLLCLLQQQAGGGSAAGGGGATEEGRRALLDGSAGGALKYLRHIFMSPYFRLDDGILQELVSCVAYRLVGQMLQADAVLGGALSKAAAERCLAPFRAVAGAGAGETQGSRRVGDHYGHVLGLLASCFTAHPQLWLNPVQPCALDCRTIIEHFISKVGFTIIEHFISKVGFTLNV